MDAEALFGDRDSEDELDSDVADLEDRRVRNLISLFSGTLSCCHGIFNGLSFLVLLGNLLVFNVLSSVVLSGNLCLFNVLSFIVLLGNLLTSVPMSGLEFSQPEP